MMVVIVKYFRKKQFDTWITNEMFSGQHFVILSSHQHLGDFLSLSGASPTPKYYICQQKAYIKLYFALFEGSSWLEFHM